MVTNCTSPILVSAVLTPSVPSYNSPPKVTWSGGTPVDDLDVSIPCAAGTTTFAAAIGQYLTAQVKVVVAPTYTISGTITAAGGKGVSGITVDPQKSVSTDSNGYYSWTVPAGGSYIVQPNDLSGTYWFSPQNTPATNINSNQTANFTANPVTKVYLIHGIGQTANDMSNLATNLYSALDPTHYQVDSGFTFGCATTCSGSCSVPPGSTLVNLGAQWLAYYIQQQKPPGNIILVGYSMGGLIARDLVANNYSGVLTGHPVTALITLGTPNLGYPYSSLDPHLSSACSQILLDMSGSFDGNTNGWGSSPYLDNLRHQWVSASYSGYWMAAAGEQCPNQFRNAHAPGEDPVGCPSWSVTSDGVVCRDSALYGFGSYGFGVLNPAPKADVPWSDIEYRYVHTNSFAGWGTAGILCGNTGDPTVNPQLFDPPPSRTLFPQIQAVINAH